MLEVTMGKRKRTADETNTQNDASTNPDLPSSSDDMPCFSGTELLSKENSSNLIETGMDIGDDSLKLLNAQTSAPPHHYSLGRSIFLKRSRHYYGHQYARRNPGNHANPSASHSKSSPSYDKRLSFKLAGQCKADYGRYAERMEKAFSRPERIRSSSLVMDALSADGIKMVCGVCQKVLKRKPYFLENAVSSGEFSVVAVLVCGHVYHADCLEQKTSAEARRDPPCPLCCGSLTQD